MIVITRSLRVTAAQTAATEMPKLSAEQDAFQRGADGRM
jgi:hypothetical protein